MRFAEGCPFNVIFVYAAQNVKVKPGLQQLTSVSSSFPYFGSAVAMLVQVVTNPRMSWFWRATQGPAFIFKTPSEVLSLILALICNVAPILLSSDLPSVEERVSCLLSIQSPLLLPGSTPVLSKCPPRLHAACGIGGSWALQWMLISLSPTW